MKELQADWFTQGIVDFEHKKYILLAYLKHISENFNSKKVYPFLSDLVFHFENLRSLKESQSVVKQAMPKKLRKFDLDNFRLEYERIMDDDDYMQEIEIILDFAIPKIKTALSDGKEIYEYVEENIAIEPIGILPLNKEFGYMILNNGNSSESKVYEYEFTIFENASEKFRSIRTLFVSDYSRKFTQTFESIKIDLIRTHKKFANPATFAINSSIAFPYFETFLPIAKRSFVRHIYSGEA